MGKILICGGTGLIGKHLQEKLKEKGYFISILSRKLGNIDDKSTFKWNIEKRYIDMQAFNNVDYIINLSGANIGKKRWTAKRRKIILESRVKTTDFIFDIIKQRKIKINAYISASAVGFYGSVISDNIFNESDQPNNDFLGNICLKWEQSAEKFKDLGIRTVKIRTGVVLSDKGGALVKMIKPVKNGLGAPLGTGKQYLPWIHIDDICDIYIKAIEDYKMNDSYNAVAPEHITNKEFNKILTQILKKPFLNINVPSIALKMMFGKMSEIILKGSRVSSEKIINRDYKFKYPDLKSALIDLLIK